MPRYPVVRVEEVIRALERDGWREVRSRGAHRQFKHPEKSGLVTISMHPGRDVHPQTLKFILRQANLALDEFVAYLRGRR